MRTTRSIRRVPLIVLMILAQLIVASLAIATGTHRPDGEIVVRV